MLPVTVPIVFFFALYRLRRNLKYNVWIKILPSVGSPSKEGVLVLLWFIIISLVFFYLNEVLISGFLQFNGNFVDGQDNSTYRENVLL